MSLSSTTPNSNFYDYWNFTSSTVTILSNVYLINLSGQQLCLSRFRRVEHVQHVNSLLDVVSTSVNSALSYRILPTIPKLPI